MPEIQRTIYEPQRPQRGPVGDIGSFISPSVTHGRHRHQDRRAIQPISRIPRAQARKFYARCINSYSSELINILPMSPIIFRSIFGLHIPGDGFVQSVFQEIMHR